MTRPTAPSISASASPKVPRRVAPQYALDAKLGVCTCENARYRKKGASPAAASATKASAKAAEKGAVQGQRHGATSRTLSHAHAHTQARTVSVRESVEVGGLLDHRPVREQR